MPVRIKRRCLIINNGVLMIVKHRYGVINSPPADEKFGANINKGIKNGKIVVPAEDAAEVIDHLEGSTELLYGDVENGVLVISTPVATCEVYECLQRGKSLVIPFMFDAMRIEPDPTGWYYTCCFWGR